MDTLDHIGIAVEDIDEALAQYKNLYGFTLEHKEEVPSQNVIVAFIKLQNTRLELLSPTSPESTVRKFLDKRGPGLHHVCYAVKNIREELQLLASKGCELIDEEPRDGAHNTLIAFLHPRSTGGILTELCQYK